jgi:hypothetical protein
MMTHPAFPPTASFSKGAAAVVGLLHLALGGPKWFTASHHVVAAEAA